MVCQHKRAIAADFFDDPPATGPAKLQQPADDGGRRKFRKTNHSYLEPLKEGEIREDEEGSADESDRYYPWSPQPMEWQPHSRRNSNSSGTESRPSAFQFRSWEQDTQAGSSSASVNSYPSRPQSPRPMYHFGSIQQSGKDGVQNNYFGKNSGPRYYQQSSRYERDADRKYDTHSQAGRNTRAKDNTHHERHQNSDRTRHKETNTRSHDEQATGGAQEPHDHIPKRPGQHPRGYCGGDEYLVNNSAADVKVGTIIVAPYMVFNTAEHHKRPERVIDHPAVGSIYAVFRKYIVVRIFESHTLGVPICSYGGDGLLRRSLAQVDDHMPLFDEKHVPRDAGDSDGDFLTVKAPPVPIGPRGARGRPFMRQSATHEKSFVNLAKPSAVDFTFPMAFSGRLTDDSVELLLSRYAMIHDKGLQEPIFQRRWQRDMLDSPELLSRSNSMKLIPATAPPNPFIRKTGKCLIQG